MLCVKLYAYFKRFSIVFQAVLIEYFLWNSVPLIRLVSSITEIFNSNLAGKETTCCQITHRIKKRNSLLHLWLGFFRERDFIHYFNLLLCVTRSKIRLVTFHTLNVQPFDTTAKGCLIVRHVLHNELNEGWNSRITRAS